MGKTLTLFIILAMAAWVFTSCRTPPPPEPDIEVYVPVPEPPKEPISFEPNAFESRVFELTNFERRMQRLPPLIWHEAAAFVARQHSMDMLENNFMRHTGSDGSNIRERLERGCIKDKKSWSANIAGGYLTPEEVVAAWMESPMYRPNILSGVFTHIGVGFVERPIDSNSRFATYWTIKFLTLD